MVFEVGITFFIHLVCIFSLFAGVPKQLESVLSGHSRGGERGRPSQTYSFWYLWLHKGMHKQVCFHDTDALVVVCM